jgi:ribokinase
MEQTIKPERGVAIFGVSQTDYYSYVEHFPKEGETIFATKFLKLPGGKGTNQVYMISKLMETAPIVFITCVGDDEEGDFLKKSLTHIDAGNIYTLKDVKTTISQNIVVNEKTTTILVPGANQHFLIEHVDRSWQNVLDKKCAVFLCGLDTPLNVTAHALKRAKRDGLITIFNPTPIQGDLPDEVFQNSDIICPNECEALTLTGIKVVELEDAYKAGDVLLKRGCKHVIITMGDKGVVHMHKDHKTHFPANKVKVVDASGAGDCFVGSLAYFMATSIDISDGINLSSYLASISVQFVGIQASYPSRNEIF